MKLHLLFIALFLQSVVYAQAQDKFSVFFDTGKAEINEASDGQFRQWLSENKEVLIVKIHGFTDAVGSAEDNQDLSERRAAYVYSKLKEVGLDLASVHEQGFGENKAGANEEDSQLRRVDIYYTKRAAELTQAVLTSKVGDKLRLPNLYFYNHSDEVVPGSKPVLKELLKIMQDNLKLKIEIQGHVCCQKVDITSVSTQRAKAVYKYLVENGIAKERLSYKGFGSKSPIYKLPEKNEKERNANRRVEIQIIDN